LFWDRRRGVFLARRDEDGGRDKNDVNESAWRKEEFEKNLAESKRLFYVALTRARERLVLVCTDAVAAATVENIHDKDFWRGWMDSQSAGAGLPVVRAPVPAGIKADAESKIATPRNPATYGGTRTVRRPRHSVTEWNTLARCALAYEKKYIRPIEKSGMVLMISDAQNGDSAIIDQRTIGTRVHACLENRDFEQLKQIEAEAGEERFLAAPLIEWAKASPLMAPPEAGRTVWTELAFEAPIAGEVLVGAIDRVVREDGVDGPGYRIIDFKISARPKSAQELLGVYKTQIELYAWALGTLEPAALGRTRAYIVNISGRSVIEVEVPLPSGSNMPQRLAEQASAIVNGQSGPARAGDLCGVCEFRSNCFSPAL
jgi:ATP-dependent exoDNAse (exonuclease V) beta subunit